MKRPGFRRVLSATLILVALLPQVAWAAGQVDLQPGSGPAGSGFNVVLTAFAPGEKVQTITFGTTVLAQNLTVSSAGDLIVPLVVPAGAAPGTYLVSVKARGPAVSRPFQVTSTGTTTTTTTTTTSTSTTTSTTTTTTPTTTTSSVATTTTTSPATVTPTSSTTPGSVPGTTIGSSDSTGPDGSGPLVTTNPTDAATSPDGPDRQAGGFLGEGGGGWTWWALLLALLVAGGLGLLRWAARRTPPVAAPEAPPPVFTGPVVPPRPSPWRVVELAIESGARLERIIRMGGRYWAGGLATVSGMSPARVWRSDDGLSWLPVGFMEPGLVTDLCQSDGMLAVGHVVGLEGQPVASTWILEPDDRWKRITGITAAELDGAVMERVTGIANNLVATTRDRDGLRLMLSANGAMWNRARIDGSVERVLRLGETLLAFGRGPERETIVLESGDGIDWTAWPSNQTLPFQMSQVECVIGFQGGWVVGGVDRAQLTAAVWVSDDAIRWHRVPVDFGRGTAMAAIVRHAGGLVAVATQHVPTQVPRVRVWRSTDAVAWDEVVEASLDDVALVGVVENEGAIEVYGRANPREGLGTIERWVATDLLVAEPAG